MASETSVAELLALESELLGAMETAADIEEVAIGECALKDLRAKIEKARQDEEVRARFLAFCRRQSEEAAESRKQQAFRIADAVAVCAQKLREEGELTGLLRVLVAENECTVSDWLTAVSFGRDCP